MTIDEFTATLHEAKAPAGVSPALRALWLDGRGDWNGAHETAQEIDDAVGAWVHAYLHRKEGDDGNAAYWYRRASKPVSGVTLDEEWRQIVSALLVSLSD
jgi:hypothetical protein